MRQTNTNLKEDNTNLLQALKATQENFRKELVNMKLYERQMREQQEALSKMQVSSFRTQKCNESFNLDLEVCFDVVIRFFGFVRKNFICLIMFIVYLIRSI